MKYVKRIFPVIAGLFSFSCGSIDWMSIFALILAALFNSSSVYNKSLGIPYCSQGPFPYCAASCVTMWRLYDKVEGSEESDLFDIAPWIDNHGGRCDATIAAAVEEFTNSRVSPIECNLSDRDLILPTAIATFDKKDQPSIFILYHGTHAIILDQVTGRRFPSYIAWSSLGCKDPVKTQTNQSYSKEQLYADWNDGMNCNQNLTFVQLIRGDCKKTDSPLDFDSSECLRSFYKINGTYYWGPASFSPEGLTNIIRVKYPIGAEGFESGKQMDIEWESIGLSGNIKLELLKGDSFLGTIATDLPISQSSYIWTVGQYQGGAATVGDDYKIKITMMDGSDYDTSNVDFSITPQLPDVSITNITLAPAAPTPGEKVTIKATIKNNGLAATPNEIDVGTAIKVDGAYLGNFFVNTTGGNHRALAAGESYQGTCSVQWTATVGKHTFWVMADDVDRFPESNEDNNFKETTVTIANVLPDVVITSISLVPAAPIPGQMVTVRATIKNQGTAATPTGVYMGVGFKVDGIGLGSFFVRDTSGNHKTLAVGESFAGTCNTQWTATVGKHTFRAMADDVDRFPESNEDNNVKETTVTSANVLPDVVITSISLVPAVPTPGQMVTVKATIKNQGTAATPTGVYVGVGFKVDGTGLGSFFVRDTSGNHKTLAVGESFAGTCGVQWSAAAGSHTVWAMADDINRFPESDDGNNVKTKSVTVQ